MSMLPEGTPYSEEQIREIVVLYEQLKEQFIVQKDYAQVLLTKAQNGDQLLEREVTDLGLFIKVSDTLYDLENLIVTELSAQIFGLCEEARLKAKDGDPEWAAKWERMQPIYQWHLELMSQRLPLKN